MKLTDNPTIRVWITKYALTTGIYEADAEHCLSTSERMVKIGRQCFHLPDWHLTAHDAVLKARLMASRSIDSHTRSIVKLRGLLGELE